VTTTIRVAALAGAVALLAAPALADDSTELSDHLPDALEGDRIVHVRTQGGDGAIACDRLRLEPKGSPSDRVGTAVIEESGARFEIDYAGSPLVLSSPRMVVAGKRVPLPCKSDEGGAWFMNAPACRDPEILPRIAPRGCGAALAPAARAQARQALVTGARDDLAATLKRAKTVWHGPRCEPYVFKQTRDQLLLFTRDEEHALTVKVASSKAGRPLLTFDEGLVDNPHYVRPPKSRDGESIGLGCCAMSDHEVISVAPDRIELQSGGPTTWYLKKSACTAARTR